jgi:hypothetical protein
MARALEKAYPDIADEDKTASFISELFPDKMKQAQALLESASMSDSRELYQAVRALREDPSDVSKSPHSRRLSGSSGSRRVPSSSLKAAAPSPASKSSSRSGKNLPKGRSSLTGKQLVDDMEDKTPAVSRQRVEKPSSLFRWVVRWMVRLVVLGLLGTLVWAVVWGPLHAPAQPYISKIEHWIRNNVFYRAPVIVEKPLEELAQPGWLIERRAEEERLAKEKEAMQEYDRRLNEDPAFQKLLSDIDEQVRQIADMENEQRALKAAVQEDRRMGNVNTRKIEELEKKIEALSKELEVNRTKKAKIEGKTIQVVDDVGKATKEGLGYFSLSTSNPASAKVYFKNNYIGTTPLVDTLIEEGMQEFHLVDSSGQRRRLAIPISRGQKLNVAIDIKTLPLVAGPR